jgi:hypothetical protein
MNWSRLALITCLVAASPPLARAEEDVASVVDTEHIFGFTEGTDIGDKGERELEIATTGLFGKSGSFVALGTESTLRYGVADGFRTSLGMITDYHYVRNSSDSADRAFYGFGGLTSEFRWTLQERDKSPFGLVLSFAPEWRQRDSVYGAPLSYWALPIGVLVDKALIEKKFYVAMNAFYQPNFTHPIPGGPWSTQNASQISVAAAYSVAPRIFIGAEVRQLAQNVNGFMTTRGLYVGPSVYWRVTDSTNLKVAWSAQLPDPGAGRLDLVNYERHQIFFQFATGF